MKKSFLCKLKYGFDNTMSKGTASLIMWLGIISFLMILIASIVLIIFQITPADVETMSFIEAFWASFMRAIDAGTLGGDNGWQFRIIMLFVTLGGIFIVSALIGVLNSGLDSKLTELRKGKSLVLEHNHTLILGWSSKIFTIISELIVANENQKKPRIVILAEKDKVEMEDEIKVNIRNTKNTKIICRNGSSNDNIDLNIVNANDAKSIIILSPENAENPDIFVIKAILAITNNPNRRKKPYHIVAEIKNTKYVETAKMIGKDELTIVLSTETISRITVQTCRQSGLSIVYEHLLQFEGDEIYFQEEPKLFGKTYKDAALAYETSSIFGIRTSNGKVTINPSKDTLINKGDQVIAISEDDDTVIMNAKSPEILKNIIQHQALDISTTEKILILSWNEEGFNIVRELNNYVKKGSEITIVFNNPAKEQEIKAKSKNYENITIRFIEGDITNRILLESLIAKQFNYIIILSDYTIDMQEADAITLISLLHIRDIAAKSNIHINLVSEMQDVKNMQLARITKDTDFIVSEKLISLLMTMISENKELADVFGDILDAEGNEIYLKPVSLYIKPGSECNFYTIVEAALEMGHTPIGYRKLSEADVPEKMYGIHLNPKKSEKVLFTEADKIIVFAED